MKRYDAPSKPRARAARLSLTPAAQDGMRALRLSLGDLLLIVGQGRRRVQGDDTFYTLAPNPAAPRRWHRLCGYEVRANGGLISEVSRYQATEQSVGDEPK